MLFDSIKKTDPTACLDLSLVNEEFQKCFVSFRDRILAFKHTRMIIQIDGCFLKNNFKNQLLCAVAIYGRIEIFPIALGVVSKENLKNLRFALEACEINVSSIIFVSDRQNGLLLALKNNFKKARNFICMRHLANNLKRSRFKK